MMEMISMNLKEKIWIQMLGSISLLMLILVEEEQMVEELQREIYYVSTFQVNLKVLYLFWTSQPVVFLIPNVHVPILIYLSATEVIFPCVIQFAHLFYST